MIASYDTIYCRFSTKIPILTIVVITLPDMLQLKMQHYLFSGCQNLCNIQVSYVPMRMTKEI